MSSGADKVIRLNKHEATGLAAFHYWHKCPECGYLWIQEEANFCGGCGKQLKFCTPKEKICQAM